MTNPAHIVAVTTYHVECPECGEGIEHSRVDYDEAAQAEQALAEHDCGPKVTLDCGAIIRTGPGGWDFDPTSPIKDYEHPGLHEQAWAAVDKNHRR